MLVGDTNPDSVATHFEDLGEQNTGDPTTLRDFTLWAADVAPARNYGIILWDDGAGLIGSNFDNADAGQPADHLTTNEVVTALDQAAVPNLRLLAFDSCLMAVAEVGYSLRELTDVFVGSQEVVGGDGHDYTTLFESLYGNPRSVGAEELAAGFVSSYQWQYQGIGGTSDTQSAMRTNGYDDLAQELGAFVQAADGPTDEELDSLRRARNASVGYAVSSHRDLGGFMRLVEQDEDLSAGIRSAAANVRQAVEAMLVARSSDTRNSSGISIFLPSNGNHVESYASEYASFDAISGWSTFLQQLGVSERLSVPADWAERGSDPILAENFRVVVGHGNTYGSLKLEYARDVDWFRFSTDQPGGAGDRVAVAPVGDGAITLRLYDQDGVTLLGETTGSGEQSISLEGRTAAEYLIHVSSDLSNVPYSLTIDAPGGDTTRDWAGNISTLDKAYPLGVIDKSSAFTNLTVTDTEEDWLTFDTPRLGDPMQFVMTVAVGEGSPLTVELHDAEGNVVRSATGSGQLRLPYTASGAAETYTVHVEGEDAGTTSYNLLFQPFFAPWQNPSERYDVTDEGVVSAADVLRLINYINAHPNEASLPALPLEGTDSYYDVNGDNLCSPVDVLDVINEINRRAAEGQGSGGEGESRTGLAHSEAGAEAKTSVSTDTPNSLAPSIPEECLVGYLRTVVPPAESTSTVRFHRHGQDAHGAGSLMDDRASTKCRETAESPERAEESVEDGWENLLDILADEITGVATAEHVVDSLFADDMGAFGIG